MHLQENAMPWLDSQGIKERYSNARPFVENQISNPKKDLICQKHKENRQTRYREKKESKEYIRLLGTDSQNAVKKWQHKGPRHSL